jgi:hypothetical protein
MPMTPEEAAIRTPKMELSFPEMKAVSDLEELINKSLSTDWEGGLFRVHCNSPIPNKVISAVVRKCEEASWDVQVFPVDGKTAKAQDLLARGMPCEYLLLLRPKWKARPVIEGI